MEKRLDIRKWEFKHTADFDTLEDLKEGLSALDSSLFERNPVLVLLKSSTSFEVYSDGRNFDRDVLYVGRSRYGKDKLPNILRILLSINRSKEGASSAMLIKWYRNMHPNAVQYIVQTLKVDGEVYGERDNKIYRYKITDVGIKRLQREGLGGRRLNEVTLEETQTGRER